MSRQEYLAVKVFSRISSMYSCGFKNSEALIEKLGDPDHARYYTVDENTGEEKKIQETMLMKRHLLLAINGLRARSSGKKDQKFSQLVSVFLEGERGDQRKEAAIPEGLNFVIILMQELRALPNSGKILTQFLKQVVINLHRVDAGSFFEAADKTSFILDATLNDARAFILELIEEKKGSDPEVVHESMRLLMSLAVARQSVEDLLTVSSLLGDKTVAKDVDLRQEIHRMLQDAGQAKQQDEENEETYGSTLEDLDRVGEPVLRLFDPELHGDVIFSTFTVEGDYAYICHKQNGWFKILIGRSGGMNGQVVCSGKAYDPPRSPNCMILGGKMYVRHEGHCKGDDGPARAFSILDKNTLEELPYEGEVHTTTLEDGSTRSLHWLEAPENGGRALAKSPLITDGRNVYVVSRRVPTAADR